MSNALTNMNNMNMQAANESVLDVADLDCNLIAKHMLTYYKKKKLSSEEMFTAMVKLRDFCIKLQSYEDVWQRSVFKKSVMVVSSYGAKESTSRSDILNVLRGMNSPFLKECNSEEIKLFCKMVFICIGISYPAAKQYMDWAAKLSYQIAKANGRICYKHPITGFPVTLRVEGEEKRSHRMSLFGKAHKVYLKHKTGEVNPRKTATMTVPSIIHNIDAGILVEANKKCYYPTTLVHDSFGCHPNNKDDMQDNINFALQQVFDSDLLQDITDQLISSIDVSDEEDELFMGQEEREVLARKVKVLKAIDKQGLHKAPKQNTLHNLSLKGNKLAFN